MDIEEIHKKRSKEAAEFERDNKELGIMIAKMVKGCCDK